ncbi:hypothetical protein DL93DRAFT_2078908 [Clavulina sp. PMI_390]|nr:hypothetical protein DL93DRAFT_2078908 [Clavulina sp. PMI_390]
MTTFAGGEIEELDFIAESVRGLGLEDEPTSAPDPVAEDPFASQSLIEALAVDMTKVIVALDTALGLEVAKIIFIATPDAGGVGRDSSQPARRRPRSLPFTRSTTVAASVARTPTNSVALVEKWESLLKDCFYIVDYCVELHSRCETFQAHQRKSPFFWFLKQGYK